MENLTAVATFSLVLFALATLVVAAVVSVRHATGRRLEQQFDLAGSVGRLTPRASSYPNRSLAA